MKILLFGGSGQLGLELIRRAYDLNFEIVSPVLSEVDIGNNSQVRYLSEKVNPDLLINCAAYTAVDKAEQNRAEAFRINCEGAKNVAEAAKAMGRRLLHVSTDYVFGEGFNSPINESATTHPLNVYGESKLAGEREVLALLGSLALVIRTSSLHSSKGVNFVNTMVRLFNEREQVRVVADQLMSPTWAGWLAEVILDLCRTECTGVLHASCAGTVSWFEFANAILELVGPQLKNGGKVKLEAVTTEQYGSPTKRPKYAVLDCSKLTQLLGRQPLSWEEGVRNHLRELNFTLPK